MTASRSVAVASIGWILAAGATLLTIAIWPAAARAPVLPSLIQFGVAAVAGFAVLQLSFASMGALLAVRRPGNPIGWLLLQVGVGFAVGTFATVFATAVDGGAVGRPIGVALAAWVAVAAWPVAGVSMITVGFLFPTGRPQSRRWARALGAQLAVWAALYVISLVQPGPLLLFDTIVNPLGFGPGLAVTVDARSMPFVLAWQGVMTVVVVAAILSRYRHANALARVQLRWFILAVGVAVACTLVPSGVAITSVSRGGSLGDSFAAIGLFATGAALIPVAIGIAILRYRLYDIDRLVSRTIGYGLVSAVLLAVYGSAVVLLQDPLRNLTGGDTLFVAASTLGVATLFQPLRRRIQRLVDRRFNRARYDAERTTAAFADRVRNEVDMTALAAELDRTVRTAIEPATLGLWLRERGR